MKAIAEHFDVSTATVSKAINGLPGVGTGLRQQIVEYAKESGYVPNSFGRGLKGKKLKVIGVIITDITNPLYAINVSGLEAEAERRGYNIFLCNSKEDWRTEEQQINALLQRSVDGLIIAPTSCDDDRYISRRFDLLHERRVPFVLMYRVIERSDREYDYIKSDNVHGAYVVMQHLFDRGHEKILFLTGKASASSGLERYEGFVSAYRERGVTKVQNYVYQCDSMSFASAYQTTLDILNERDDFTAIFAINDNMAFGTINALLSRGMKVPEDIAVVGYDDNIYASMNVIPLTTVHQESDTLGRRAVGALIDKIEGKRTERLQEVVRPELVVRDSA